MYPAAATSTAGASALKWTTRTWASSQLGEGASCSTWAEIEASAPVAAIVYEAPCRRGDVGVDDRIGRGAGREDLHVVVAGRDLKVARNRPERHARQGRDRGTVELNVDRRRVGRRVQDSDHCGIGGADRSGGRDDQDAGGEQARDACAGGLSRWVSLALAAAAQLV